MSGNKKLTYALAFKHSEVQDFDGDPAVKEIILSVNDVIIAKLKAVLTASGEWEAVIRDSNGALIYNDHFLYATYMQALDQARRAYKCMLENSCDELIKYNLSLYKQEVTT